MLFRRKPALWLLLLVLGFALMGCESSEERAERHFQSGMTLLAEGDAERALVEFRNVFNLNGLHKEARITYARTQRERGEFGDAYGQFLRLVEQYPDTAEGHIALAEMAVEASNWPDAQTHGRIARDLAADHPSVLVVNTMLDYREAVLNGDDAGQTDNADIARDILTTDPANPIARNVLIDHLIKQKGLDAALAEIDAGLGHNPDQFALHMLRLRIYGELDDEANVVGALETMAAQFPASTEIQQMLIGLYLQSGDNAAAEAFLRSTAEAADATPESKMTVVEFLRQSQGSQAALSELDALLAVDPQNNLFHAMRASIRFADGDTDNAVAEMEEILATAEPSDQTRDLKVTLARMLQASENSVGARARVEEVLLEDESHVEALKMRAAWQIDEDTPDDAILSLRTALTQSPRDPQILTLMAQAHLRAGDRELAGERFGLAVEVSNQASAETLRYVRFLMADSRQDAANAVLSDALEKRPQELALLLAQSEVFLTQQEWSRVTQMIWRIRALETDVANDAADTLQANLLLRQERFDDTLSFLEGLIQQGDSSVAAKARLVQVRVQAGQIDEATAFLDDQLASSPDEPMLRFMRAGLYALANQPVKAEPIYRKLLEDLPQSDRPLRALYTLLAADGRQDEADQLIDDAIEADPIAFAPLMMKASRLEVLEDYEGAIEIYQGLYVRFSNNQIVANNLASMLATFRTDDASLQQATVIAERLRGTEIPPFQDTFGWIQYRNGNHEDALTYLEPAAIGLPEDALVQYHLAKTLQALNKVDEARKAFLRVLELAGDSNLPQLEDTRAALQELPPAEPTSD